jgi:hypothetical protein
MKVGVTGSQQKRPQRTIDRLRALLIEWGASELHHGDCVGFDAQAHEVAVSLGIRTVIHPPENPKARAFCEGDEVRSPLPYLDRNKNIVRETERMIAAPRGPEELRSGTWSTVRFAKKIGRPGVVLNWAHPNSAP